MKFKRKSPETIDAFFFDGSEESFNKMVEYFNLGYSYTSQCYFFALKADELYLKYADGIIEIMSDDYCDIEANCYIWQGHFDSIYWMENQKFEDMYEKVS